MTSTLRKINSSPISSSPLSTERMKLPRRLPLANLLVARGLFSDLDEARRWVMAGKVLVDEHCLDKPGMLISSQAEVRIRGLSRYASRGGYKLEAALHHFGLDVRQVVAIDCGASTGGFTDCLLQHGAALVYAVDVGHGQLLGRLRLDTRVRSYEQTNFSDLLAMELSPAPSLISLDLSYLSLTKALPIATSLLSERGRVLALVKPLFEVECSEARRQGSIEDPSLLVDALRRVLQAGRDSGLAVEGLAKLALRPRNGVHEFIASFLFDPHTPSVVYSEENLYTMATSPGIGQTEVEAGNFI